MAQPGRHLHPVPEAPSDTEGSSGEAGTLIPAREHIVAPGGRREDQSWLTAQREAVAALLRAGLERHARLASDWIADPSVEQASRLAAESRKVRAQVRAETRIAKARTDAQKADATNALARAQISTNEIEVGLRTSATRACRALVCASVPSGIVGAPIYLSLTQGEWVTLLAWPGVVGYLLVQEWAAGRQPAAGTSGPVRATEVPTGRREIIGATHTENRIIERLNDWDTLASKRGLAGVRRGEIRLDESGIVVVLDTNARLTPAALTKKTDVIRAVLGVPTATPIEVTPGEAGDEAVVRIRTRQKELDTTWRPDRGGIGVDSDTGEVVTLPKGRKLIAGTSGAGKSVLVRVLIAEALTSDEPTAVVYIDGKGEESALWVGKARIAVEPEEISEVVTELVLEGRRRRDLMTAQGVATWAPTEEDPRIVVVVDEGAEVMAMDSKKTPMLAGLQSIGRTGRSRCIDLVWCTQKPTLGDGIDRQINGVMEIRAVLRTAGETETRQVLGTGWRNHMWEGVGQCTVKGTGRYADQPPVWVWDLSSDQAVRALPGREPWHYRGEGSLCDEEEDALDVARRLCGDERGVHTAALAAELGTDKLGVHTAMAVYDLYPDKTPFTVGDTKARGYRREDLFGDGQ